MMDADDRRLFEESIRAATARATGPELDAELDALGWRDALADDPRTAVPVLFELLGRTGAASTALADVIGAELASLPAGLLVLPSPGSAGPAGSIPVQGRVAVHGVALRPPRGPERALVVVPGATAGLLVGADVEQLTVRPIEGLDPRLGLVEVRTRPEGVPLSGAAVPVDWDRAVAAGRIALAHQLTGAAGAMLGLAREHALARVQFGRPIAGFQAVRHRLAESLVAVETARSAVRGACDDRSAMSAGIAKALAGRCGRLVARHAQQVLAGMGFTAEHPFHGYLRRVLVLDEMLGSSRVLTRELGAELLRTRRLPDPLPL